MRRALHPLFVMLASLTHQELARQLAYLKKENQILRARLPKRIVTTPEERRTLLKAGKNIGSKLKELISIVSYDSFLRWVREAEQGICVDQGNRMKLAWGVHCNPVRCLRP